MNREGIFVVEDDPVHSLRVRFVLEEAGYRVEQAESGEAALERLKRGGLDAVLLDIGLPGIDGLDVLRAMREMRGVRRLPVLMVTGLEGEELMEKAFDLGAYDFITKPMNERVLLQRIRSMLRARKNQRQLTISEQRLTTLVQNLAGHAIYMLDPQGRIASWNSGAETLTGYSSEDVVGFDQSVLSADAPSPNDGGAYFREGWFKRRDGSQFYAGASINPLRDEGGTLLGFACIVRDRTRERALEDQLRQAQKLEAIGQLTGGLAHDFNNLLSIVVGNVDLCRTTDGLPEELTELLDAALDAAMRGAKLTSRMLTFARRQTLVTEVVDVDELLEGMRRLLELTLGTRIGLAIAPREEPWQIRVDRSQFESSILNLATNARDAMPDGGRLSIATGNRTMSDGAEPGINPGEYVVVEVSDTGHGMSEDVVARIFEPFFTTKASGVGTGLGLSMVFGFAAQSGGGVRVRTSPGEGTTFELYFPRVLESVDLPSAVDDGQRGPRVTGQTVLAVENETALLRIVERELSELGYRVQTATDGASAAAMLERERFDVLFSDVVMPGTIDGFALAEMVLERWPATRVVLTSGFLGTGHDDYDRRWKRMEGSVTLLRKPYRRNELAAAIRAPGTQAEPETNTGSRL